MQNIIYKKDLLDNDSDNEENNENVNWTIESEEESESESESDKEQNTEDFEEIINNNIKNISKEPPEINIEVIKGKDNEKCVQVTINMELENKSKDIINLDFIINKKIFLKIAKQLK